MERQIFNKFTKFNEIIDINLKNSIINIIYSNINTFNLKYQIINNISSLEIIKKNNYLVTPHINGTHSLLIIVELYKQKYQCIINKKDIKYYKNQINISAIKIYNFWTKSIVPELMNLYNLTILDGRFIIVDDTLNYLLFNVHVLNGNSLHTLTIQNKFKIIDNILTMLNKNLFTQFIIKIITIYSLQELEFMIFDKIKNSRLKINGLIFLPEKNEKSYIYINDNEFNLLKEQIPYFDTYSNLKIPNIPKSLYDDVQLDKNNIQTFVCKKTIIPDVIELYKYTNYLNLYNNIIITNRIGIAHIPNIAISQYCKIKCIKNDVFINKCIYNIKFNKWTPIIE